MKKEKNKKKTKTQNILFFTRKKTKKNAVNAHNLNKYFKKIKISKLVTDLF